MRRAFFFLLFLLPAAAFAQPPGYLDTGRFELTPFVGYRLEGDFEASDFADVDVEVDEGAAFGLIFDIPLDPNWQIELLANRQETAFVSDEGLFNPAAELGDVTLTHLHVGILFQWGLGQVSPFITGSLGLAHIEPEFDDLDADDRFATSFGGGVKLFLADNVGLRLEGRWYWTDLGDDFDDDDFHHHDDEGAGLFQVEGSVGLVIAF
ncbi:MAG TPA: outer membrane beta-barrel protein [Thermoanaerobaculia bacterium]